MLLTVGFVVPCKNEAATLRACLSALRRQAPLARLVVMDNGSTDGSLEIAHQLADEVVDLPGVSISHLRNEGAAQVGDVDLLGFVDGDVVVGAGWLAAGLAALEHGADLVGSRSSADPEATWVATRWAEVEQHRAHGSSSIWGQHLLVRRSVFVALDGFDESLRTGEDADLSARARAAGFEVRLVPAMGAAHHGFPSTLRGFVRRELWHTSTPGWLERMAPRSRALVQLSGLWFAGGTALLLGAALTRRSSLVGAWLAGSAVGLSALGRVAGGTFRHSPGDGTLIGLWSAVRVGRLVQGAVSRSSRRAS